MTNESIRCQCPDLSIEPGSPRGHEPNQCQGLVDGLYRRDGGEVWLCGSCCCWGDELIVSLVDRVRELREVLR